MQEEASDTVREGGVKDSYISHPSPRAASILSVFHIVCPPSHKISLEEIILCKKEKKVENYLTR